jgi:hypothetical protein
MNILSQIALTELLPAGDAEALSMAEKFDAVAPVMVKDENNLSRAVSEGWYAMRRIDFNGSAAFMLWYSISPMDGGLWIHASQSYHAEGVTSAVCFAGIELLAKMEKAPWIRFMTIRGGLARDAKKHGYVVEGVILRHG